MVKWSGVVLFHLADAYHGAGGDHEQEAILHAAA